ncbi:(2Fe-2S)-binding protein [Gracilibacillus oryzae]|uniref:(2Fe-2S)-binding protein n=1 Tax=Gracilibacillus oryzae TaxID=1672701 RepID=A0A7C8GUD6_9BACI|nr:(2Fe-2S)-binding protein [Gracilibacillus oryzae]KAB8138231.1 (2Fe-2S)-binding protein [Gracilibacillus oryzae]
MADSKKTLLNPPIAMKKIMITINCQAIEEEVNPTTRLVDILRNHLHLTGTKISCGIGRCGACSVLLDNKLVNACMVMAYQAEGSQVITIEGIEQDGLLHPIQQAFLEEGGFQCGYCTPGMVLATKALLEENAHPDDNEIKTALSGNLCRCTGYGGILRAVRSARDRML